MHTNTKQLSAGLLQQPIWRLYVFVVMLLWSVMILWQYVFVDNSFVCRNREGPGWLVQAGPYTRAARSQRSHADDGMLVTPSQTYTVNNNYNSPRALHCCMPTAIYIFTKGIKRHTPQLRSPRADLKCAWKVMKNTIVKQGNRDYITIYALLLLTTDYYGYIESLKFLLPLWPYPLHRKIYI